MTTSITFCLEKYKGKVSRYICPKCGKSNSFTRYINIHTREYVDEMVGKCNREIKCGYHKTPREHLQEQNLMTQFNQIDYRPSINIYKPIKKKKIIGYIAPNYLEDSICLKSNFINYLLSKFSYDDVIEVIKKYYIGSTKRNEDIFWLIDKDYNIRTGMILSYDNKGHRIKNRYQDWIHSRLRKKGLLKDGWELEQCLFGEHLIIEDNTKTICLVESAKNAIIGALCYKEYIWLACGCLQNFKPDMIKNLKGRKVIAYPDLGAYYIWERKAIDISKITKANIRVSNILENIATEQEREKGLDIADFLLRERN